MSARAKVPESDSKTHADVIAVLSDEIKSASREAAEAEALAEAVQSRILEGDTVDPGELEEAEKLSRFAKLRKAGAERRKAEAEAAQLEREKEQFVADLEAAKAGGAFDVGAARQAFRDAIADAAIQLRRAQDDYRATRSSFLARVRTLGLPRTNGASLPGLHWRGGDLYLDDKMAFPEFQHLESLLEGSGSVANKVGRHAFKRGER